MRVILILLGICIGLLATYYAGIKKGTFYFNANK